MKYQIKVIFKYDVLSNNAPKCDKLHVLLTYLQKSNKHKFKKHQ